jgi:hypothetical protein
MSDGKKERLPRIPGCRYGPRIRPKTFGDNVVGYQVVQSGFWQDSSIIGPWRETKEEAIAAWKRMAKTIKNKYSTHTDRLPNAEDNRREASG